MYLRTRRAFTIVEMLVVIAVIAALISLLAVGLQAAQRSSKRTRQLSELRQIYTAWMQYANTYSDSLMPGFVDEGVQAAWKVSYKYKDGTKIPAQYAQTYPWRLLPYLDHNFATLYDYLDVGSDDDLKPKNFDGSANTAGMQIVSDQPAFGYNAYYLGGWWKTDLTNGPTLTFGNSTWQDAAGATVTGRVVATKYAGIINSESMIVFAASTFRQPGFYNESKEEGMVGSPWLVPHTLADQQIWEPSDGDTFEQMQAASLSMASLHASATLAQQVTTVAGQTGLKVHQAQGVPLRRFGPTVALIHADGHTAPAGLGELLDQRRWMNPAWSATNSLNFTHSQN
ncbi:MAG: type II secretion system protein [Phycisphaerae bacterium]|nr:type II secretion system protein [Phycisphaerae bacterium]